MDSRNGKPVLWRWLCTGGQLTEPVLTQDVTPLVTSFQVTKNNKHAESPHLTSMTASILGSKGALEYQKAWWRIPASALNNLE